MSALAPIVLQNSKVAGLRIFLENAKRETIADSYNLNRVSEVAREFKVRRWGPSHLYTKTAPVARRIFDHQCKTTFATQSTRKRPIRCFALMTLRANSRPEQAQQTEQAYSITSSARMSKIVGISRPSALAVRKLITRSNLVGSTNGSSLTFSPFRMRPT